MSPDSKIFNIDSKMWPDSKIFNIDSKMRPDSKTFQLSMLTVRCWQTVRISVWMLPLVSLVCGGRSLGRSRGLQCPQRGEHSVSQISNKYFDEFKLPSLPGLADEVLHIVHLATMKADRAVELHTGPDSRLKVSVLEFE